MIVNGVSTTEPTIIKRRPKKADQGHSVILVHMISDARRLAVRTSLRCQCGARMSGWGNRADYAHTAHVKKALGLIKCVGCGNDYKREEGDSFALCYSCLPIIEVSSLT